MSRVNLGAAGFNRPAKKKAKGMAMGGPMKKAKGMKRGGKVR